MQMLQERSLRRGGVFRCRPNRHDANESELLYVDSQATMLNIVGNFMLLNSFASCQAESQTGQKDAKKPCLGVPKHGFFRLLRWLAV
jgi:hypothetical protein